MMKLLFHLQRWMKLLFFDQMRLAILSLTCRVRSGHQRSTFCGQGPMQTKTGIISFPETERIFCHNLVLWLVRLHIKIGSSPTFLVSFRLLSLRLRRSIGDYSDKRRSTDFNSMCSHIHMVLSDQSSHNQSPVLDSGFDLGSLMSLSEDEYSTRPEIRVAVIKLKKNLVRYSY